MNPFADYAVSAAEMDRVVRRFTSGAQRDDDSAKPEFGGFLSPLVLKAYGDYMHQHRTMRDGSRRGAADWKQGIPQRVYFESLLRHVMDVWFHLDGHPSEAREDLPTALCAVLFNASGLLYETLKAKL
jgi:hypothetical protein